MQAKFRYLSITAACLIGILISCSPSTDGTAASRIDILIAGGTVFDGSGGPAILADVGVVGDRIVFVGDAEASGITSENRVDAKGMWVAPGFIDIHSHAKLDRDYGRDALPYLYQGITSVVLGVDGQGSADVAQRLRLWNENGIGVNGMLYVGHGALREEVIGRDDREPSAAELDLMRDLVRKGMDEGAFGLSSGLFYVPGTYAETEEVIELGKVAAQYEGAIYDTHDRDLGAVYRGVGYDASVKEGIRIGADSGLRTIFSHYNLQGVHNYGRADVGANYINEARRRGIDVWAAQHPYTATQSNLRSYTIPDWASAGGKEEMIRRFNDPVVSRRIREATDEMLRIRGGAEKIVFVDPRPELTGRTLADIAAEYELTPAKTAQEILRDGDASVLNLELYDHNNTRRLAQEAWMMTCTDGSTPRPDQPLTHPRTYGAFPMKMRLFVFDEPLLSPEFVIRSFSGLAADFLQLTDRGYIKEGYAADITILDSDKYSDKSTYEAPRQYAEGVEYVLVNGSFAIHAGEPTGALAGRPVTRPSLKDN